MIEGIAHRFSGHGSMSKDTKKRLRSKYRPKGGSVPGMPAVAIDPRVRRECEEEGLDPIDWNIYFGNMEPSKATCDDCYERRNELCAGGREPIKCLGDDRRAQMRLRTAR
jgi:hypothetical protein